MLLNLYSLMYVGYITFIHGMSYYIYIPLDCHICYTFHQISVKYQPNMSITVNPYYILWLSSIYPMYLI